MNCELIKLRIKKIIIIAASMFLIFSMILTSSCGAKGADIIIAGSTSVQPYAEMLAGLYESTHPGIKIEVQGGGSSAGIQAVESGTANIGMSSRALKEAEEYLWSIEIAKDGLAIIIHPDNSIIKLEYDENNVLVPVADLTLEQVRKIYTGEITNWSELGGHDAKIHVSTREEGSGTRSAFEDLVMDKNRITSKAIVQDSNGSIRQFVSDDVYSIGYISLGLVNPERGQKEVKDVRLDGVKAEEENIINHSYKLYRSFLFVTLDEPEGLIKEFIDFVLSPESQQLLENEGLIPIKKTE